MVQVAVKICGLRTLEALDVALEAGADMVGFVFFPPSPRHVRYAEARALGEHVRGRAQKVALSVDADDDELAASIAALEPDSVITIGRSRIVFRVLAQASAPAGGGADPATQRHDMGGFWGPGE